MARNVAKTALTALFLTASALTLAACRDAALADTPPPAAVVTVANPLVQVEPGWSEHSGRFVAAQTVEVRPRISGYLKAVHFRDGEFVRQGQLLFTLDPLPLQAKTDRSSAELLQADARVERALADLRRAERLNELDAISAEELDTRKEAATQAKAAQAAAQAAVRADKLDLGYTNIYAPISGRISDRRVDAGNLVQSGETILTQIVSVNPIRFEFAAPEELQAQAGALRDSPREVRVKLEGETVFGHQGKLDFVDNHIDPATGALRARAEFDNAKGQFTAGQFGRVRVLTTTAQPVLLAPETAISADQTRKFVLVVDGADIVQNRTVEVGAKVGELRVIKKGLQPSDRIIINGQQRAIPGTPVKPQRGVIAAAVAQG